MSREESIVIQRFAFFLGVLLFALVARAEVDPVLIDVRSAEEYIADHVAGAVNIPHDEIRQRIHGSVPDQSTTVYVYCRSGKRAGLAEEALVAAGYTNVVNLGGLEEARTQVQQH